MLQVLKYLPTTVIGVRRGKIPKEYWKNPRPIRNKGGIPTNLRMKVIAFFINEPSGNVTWSYTFVSPNEQTGTIGTLKQTSSVIKMRICNSSIKPQP